MNEDIGEYRVYGFDLREDTIPNIEPTLSNFAVKRRLAPVRAISHLAFHILSPLGFYRYSAYDGITHEEIAYVSTIKWSPEFDFIHRFGGGIHIGPDATKEKYRGKGLHPYLITYALKDLKNRFDSGELKSSKCWMFVLEDNISSYKGIERSGFHFCGRATHDGFWYKLVEDSAVIPIVRDSDRKWSFLFTVVNHLRKR